MKILKLLTMGLDGSKEREVSGGQAHQLPPGLPLRTLGFQCKKSQNRAHWTSMSNVCDTQDVDFTVERFRQRSLKLICITGLRLQSACHSIHATKGWCERPQSKGGKPWRQAWPTSDHAALYGIPSNKMDILKLNFLWDNESRLKTRDLAEHFIFSFESFH